MTIAIRQHESERSDPFLVWDSVWSLEEGQADWRLAEAGAPGSGGLAADEAIATAVVIQLFTDRRCPPDHPLARLAGDDQGGWWGDGVDVVAERNETALGSLLWLLQRAPLDADTERWAQSFALEALAPLVTQGLAARVDAIAEARPADNRLTLTVRLHASDGAVMFDRRFDDLWRQTRRL